MAREGARTNEPPASFAMMLAGQEESAAPVHLVTRALGGKGVATEARRLAVSWPELRQRAHNPPFFRFNASLSAMVSRDNSTTVCRNLMFSASRNERRLIVWHAGSASSCSCECRLKVLEPTVLGLNTDTGFIAAPHTI